MSARQLARVIADSLSPDGVRITTQVITLPRIVLAELNTHRAISKSSASSRAVPIEKMIAAAESDPYIPEQWDRNGAGMQGHGLIEGADAERCVAEWLTARDEAVARARSLYALGVHKQTTNRLLEPFLWHTVIVTATEWDNFFNLRCNPLAHPALRNTAEAMRAAMGQSTPRLVNYGEWHLPYFDPERDTDIAPDARPKVCAARCARVSYLTHDGIRDPSKDVALSDKLLTDGHMAPLEHVARPMGHGEATDLIADATGARAHSFGQGKGIDTRDMARPEKTFAGNFRGWVQLRKTIPGEADILGYRSHA